MRPNFECHNGVWTICDMHEVSGPWRDIFFQFLRVSLKKVQKNLQYSGKVLIFAAEI